MSHLFRHESGKMVAVLVKIFGSQHLSMAEDVVQEALVTALENWKLNGIPDNPKAWLYRVSRNKAIDVIRKYKHLDHFDFNDPDQQLLTSEYSMSSTMDQFWEEQAIKDDFLGMMYACCQPSISQENQITFILKCLCGFSTAEVAKAFLTTEDTISKRLYRTKEHFREHNFRPSMPEPGVIADRTPAVLNTIYLMFNEGYHSTHSEQLIREDVISQAFWLCKNMLDHNATNLPEVNALMALMCFHTARMDSRLDEGGEIVLLSEQDRSKWNRELIEAGSLYIYASKFGEHQSTYHFEAAISFEHCIAKDYNSTNWDHIVIHYDALLRLNYDPVVDLNRCVAILEQKGADDAWEAVENIRSSRKLEKYYLYYAVKAEILRRKGDSLSAVANLNRAIELTKSETEKSFLKDKLAALGVN